MLFNLVLNHIYALQLWVCISRQLNKYKAEQIDTHVQHVILHVIFCLTYILSGKTHVFIYLKFENQRSKLKIKVKLSFTL